MRGVDGTVSRGAVGRATDTTGGIVGRQDDVALLSAFVDRIVHVGGSLLLSGDPGIGKSVLLASGAAQARRWGVRVLRAEGVEFESDLPYSALNQLLRPVLDELDALDPPLREVLQVALGLRNGPAPSPLAVANAVIALLRRVGGAAFVVLVVDDAHWMDAPSTIVLGMVARRAESTRIGLLMAARSSHPTLLSDAVTVERHVGPLPRRAARELALREQPGLTHFVLERLLQECDGNPLALIELGAALAADPDTTLASGQTLPLSQRLLRLYADRIRRLPEPTRTLLLAAALEPSCDGALLRSVGGRDPAVELAPAVRDRLAELGRNAAVRFAHPLVRSAVVSLAGLDERARTHRLLADALVDDPVRRAWHLGQARIGPDEDVARQLDEAAPEAFARGNAGIAIAAMTRAADLSPGSAARARRLAKAAWFGICMTTDRVMAQRLLTAAHEADPTVDDALFAAATLAHLAIEGRGDVDAVHALLATVHRETDLTPGADEVVWLLDAHAMLAYHSMRPDIWDSLDAALRRLGARAPVGDVLFAVLARGGPVAPKLAVLPELTAAVAGLDGSDDFHHITDVAFAAAHLDQPHDCRPALERMLRRYGGDGTSVLPMAALCMLAVDAVTAGDWAGAARIIDDGRALRSTDSQVGWQLEAASGVLAARRDQTAALSQACAALTERSVATPLMQLHRDVIRAEAALARAEWARAAELLRGVMPVADPFGEFRLVPLLTLDFAEAASYCGRTAEARAHVAAMRDAGCAQLSTHAALLTVGAQGVVAADDGTAAELFERAVDTPGAERRPWEYARVQLARGRRLRRGRDPRAARAPLTEAREIFEGLGAAPWVEQAAVELRATGQGVVRQGPQSSGLTAQELTIAELAARGLTNKQIAEKLTLSPRTVSTHLYRIFPKLGVASRAGLRDAIDRIAATAPGRSTDREGGEDETVGAVG